MADVIKITEFAHRRQLELSTPLGTSADLEHAGIWVQDRARQRAVGDQIPAGSLYGDDDETELGRFFELTNRAIALIEEACRHLEEGENFAADDSLMAFKIATSEMFVLREVSDSAGLLALKCFQAASAIEAVNLNPNLLQVLRSVLRQLWAAPFMPFERAAILSQEVEDASNMPALPGYNDLAAALIQEAFPSAGND